MLDVLLFLEVLSLWLAAQAIDWQGIILWHQIHHARPTSLSASYTFQDTDRRGNVLSFSPHVGHVLCKEYGFAAANFSPLHFSSFSNRLCWIWTKLRPKGRPSTLLYVDVFLVFTAHAFIEKWLPQKEMWKQLNLWFGIWGRGFIENGQHTLVNNNTQTSPRFWNLFYPNSTYCDSLRRRGTKNACGVNLELSLILKNQPSLLHYLKSSNPTWHSYSTTHYKLLPRPLSHDILVITLWNIIFRRCMALWKDSVASLKPHADVSMQRGTILCATGVNLCERCCNTVNSFDQITRTSCAVTCVATDTLRNVWNPQDLPLNKQLGHVPHASLCFTAKRAASRQRDVSPHTGRTNESDSWLVRSGTFICY